MRKRPFIFAIATMASMILSPNVLGQQSNNDPIKEPKILRKGGSPGNRNQMPANPNDYLTYSILNSMLQVDYPANSLPATVLIVDKLSGFTVFSGTAINNESIDISNLGKGEFILTVTLVDNRVYSGIMEIE